MNLGMIYLVRHAHAGNKRNWDGPDTRRPLSSQGLREAAGLLLRLRGEPIARIVSSPALRCQQTVWPLADERRVTVELDPRLDVDAEAAGAAALLEDPAPGGAVLCTHGELIGQLLGRLRRAGAPIAADAAWPKGSTWVLHPTTDRIAQATYLPPLRHAD
ncbi:MAG TPA: phosphoglycerate mutase family protein [Actinomycetes bacterium]|jgi:broad specificity phosphatase PhoE|nr:phosphoglycerate mutase family protein [Actinomycetes bacterium]